MLTTVSSKDRTRMDRRRTARRTLPLLLPLGAVLGLPGSAAALSFVQEPLSLGFGNPSTIAVADFDGDGLRDVAVGGNSGTSVSVTFGGRLAPPATLQVGGQSNRVAAGDLDGDGLPDLVAAVSTG